MSLYLLGRAIGGFAIAWGTSVLLLYYIPIHNPILLFVFVWTWLVVVGAFAARLMDWRKTSHVRTDALVIFVIGVVIAVGGLTVESLL